MGAIGWIWAWLMLLGGVRAHLTQSLPHELIWAMMLSGIVALPLLWNRTNGVLASFAPSGIVRAGISLLILVVAGITHPDAVMGLIAA
ncbi:hypothetical protein ASE00_05910 [Sphingomonas sp. Root710]|uniref:hypothetical protein n=1 Tax=Sphingomonas sp. Root710 TaxID=1736594 RepID=UPI0006F6B141|nr:hypothetical protein [Sphingomonas sp. Root710]KRB86259.1 hypothetical protein ASE00_05910 [Sphingomonas sp. Root710]